MLLVQPLDAAQNLDRFVYARLVDIDGWKRRSSAASPSMCLRYSSSVVAPITAASRATGRLQDVGRGPRELRPRRHPPACEARR